MNADGDETPEAAYRLLHERAVGVVERDRDAAVLSGRSAGQRFGIAIVTAPALAPAIATQTEVVDKLKDGLNGMKQKLEQLKSKRSELLARAKSAEAQNKVHDAVRSIDVLDPTSELGRFEDKVRRQEALAAGKAEIAASTLDAQFNQLEDVGELTEVEARLAALKTGAPAPAIEQ